MTLQEAIEEVRLQNEIKESYIDWVEENTTTAIATILNAVVKGELK